MSCIYDEPLEPYICEVDWNCKDCSNWVDDNKEKNTGTLYTKDGDKIADVESITAKQIELNGTIHYKKLF